MVEPRKVRRLLGRDRFSVDGAPIDKAYDAAAFVEELRDRRVTPHTAVREHLTKTGRRRRPKIDARPTRHAGYRVSRRCRKRIEEVFGWTKVQAGQAKTRLRGQRRVEASFTLALAAYNLVRRPGPLAQAPP